MVVSCAGYVSYVLFRPIAYKDFVRVLSLGPPRYVVNKQKVLVDTILRAVGL